LLTVIVLLKDGLTNILAHHLDQEVIYHTEVFESEMAKAGLKAKDTFRAKEIVENITKEVDEIFPRTGKFFDTSTNKEQVAFYKKLNDVLFEGDLSKPINPKAI
jgi:hypothetical protein